MKKNDKTREEINKLELRKDRMRRRCYKQYRFMDIGDMVHRHPDDVPKLCKTCKYFQLKDRHCSYFNYKLDQIAIEVIEGSQEFRPSREERMKQAVFKGKVVQKCYKHVSFWDIGKMVHKRPDTVPEPCETCKHFQLKDRHCSHFDSKLDQIAKEVIEGAKEFSDDA